MSETKPGMSSLNENDVRRIFREELYKYETDLNRWLLSEHLHGLSETHQLYQQRIDAKLGPLNNED